MALLSKSVDDETSELVDAYDSLIAPQKVWRNHNNKLYLVLRAFAAGKVGIVDAALALHNRFDPSLCEDLDLYSTAKLVGTEFKHGAGSMVRITILNKDNSGSKMLAAGVYNYQSASGMIFSFKLQGDNVFAPGEDKIVTAISREKGSFPISSQSAIQLFRSDGANIDSAFSFSCDDNAGQLGYPDETSFDFRTRIMRDTQRQDAIKELELKIRNLPGIFECNLIINEGTEAQGYDGLTLEPKELLIVITGVPTDDIARLICESVIYDTHQVDPDHVIWYYNDLYIDGRRPVYYRFHDTVDFSLAVSYQYNRSVLKADQIEEAIDRLFRPYRNMVTHLSVFGEKEAYKILSKLDMQGVEILNVDVIDSGGHTVPYIRIPKTRLPCLTGIVFAVEEA